MRKLTILLVCTLFSVAFTTGASASDTALIVRCNSCETFEDFSRFGAAQGFGTLGGIQGLIGQNIFAQIPGIDSTSRVIVQNRNGENEVLIDYETVLIETSANVRGRSITIPLPIIDQTRITVISNPFDGGPPVNLGKLADFVLSAILRDFQTREREFLEEQRQEQDPPRMFEPVVGVTNPTAFLRFIAESFSGCNSFSTGCEFTPIVIDTNGDGFQFGEAGIAVVFDFTGDNTPEYTQWVRLGGDDVFLALDRNGNGLIDNGTELFGDSTPRELRRGTVKNGFKALRTYDKRRLGGNRDGLISASDEIWSRLLLWDDRNADGISDPSEISTLSSSGIVELSTRPQRIKRNFDQAGNRLPLWGKATKEDGSQVDTVDVIFRVLGSFGN